MKSFAWQVAVAGCILVLAAVTTGRADEFASSFAQQHDRIWIGGEYWANPMEDWRLQGGRLECTSAGPNRNAHLLTGEIGEAPEFDMSVRLGLVGPANANASAGFRFGIKDEIDDYRARLVYGAGIDVGVTPAGKLFIGDQSRVLDGFPDLTKNDVHVRLTVENRFAANVPVTLRVSSNGKVLGSLSHDVPRDKIYGNIALVNNHSGVTAKKKAGKKLDAKNGGRFWFQDWTIKGRGFKTHADRAFGPVLWSTYTLSRGVLKMLAHMPPIGAKDSPTVDLQIQVNGEWKLVASEKIEPMSRTAQFRVPNRNDKADVPYRLAYAMTQKKGDAQTRYYAGTIRKDPAHHKTTLVMAALSCNADYGFPSREIVGNLQKQNPDLLFFAGDNIYEYVGGYPLIRTPPDRAILNYLRKWYLAGMAFGDLCRDRPSIFLPDDHDVYQGNVWGNGGNPITLAEHQRGGYVQHRDFVNVVHRTQCGNLPDPFDPTPIKQDISVYYCPLVYGRVGFAILADRMFKSGPQGTVADWPGRPDHLKDPKIDPKTLDKPGLRLLGERQEKFLRDWGQDWKGVDMKCVLSQTIFCNLANYHGPKQEYLIADLDSGGWPQSGRNRALDLMRRCFALHVAGDQHLASLVHHGIDAPGDANWSFCVPAIANFYPRSWLPDKEGLPVQNRPEPRLPNTGDYLDGLKNHVRVYAVGNPEPVYRKSRLPNLHDKASGHGIVRFNTKERTMTMECYRLLVDVAKPGKDTQFTGWPRTIHMLDNYKRKASAHLPLIEVRGMDNAVLQVVDEKTKEVVYTLRLQGADFRPMVFSPGPFAVRVGEVGTTQLHTFKGVMPARKKGDTLQVQF